MCGRVVSFKVQTQEGGIEYIPRVFVDIVRCPAEIVTAYRTSKVAKYWRISHEGFLDPHTDTLNVILKDNVAVHESDEDKPGVILDYDKDGNLISLEVLDASKRVTDTRKVDFQMAE